MINRTRALTWQLAVFGLIAVAVITFSGLGIPQAEPVSSGAGLIEVETAHGSIDWSNGVIRAQGIGVPPKEAVNATHSREMAKRAAKVVAYRNLLEIVQGIHVDSKTTVKNYMVEQDVINNKVQGIVKNAQVTKEQEFPDGSFQTTVEMKIAGDLQATLLPARTRQPEPIKFVNTGKAPVPSRSPEDTKFTGLVVDAQGLEVQQALSPRILMEDGRVVYGAEWVDQEHIQDQGLVGYVRGVSAAQSHKRVVATPLVVKALRVEGDNKTDIVISDADAQTLHVVPEHLEFLERGKVLVVLE